MKKPRVLMIGPARNVKGGISTVVNNYYELGLDKEVELEYIATMVDGNKFKKLLVMILAYIKFCRIIHKFDIVHIHMAAQASFYRKSLFIKRAKRVGKKVIIHQHGGNFREFYSELPSKLQEKVKNIFVLADKLIVLSDAWLKYYSKNICNKDKIEVIYNGVIVPDYIRSDYAQKNILYMSRLEKEKGIYELLEVMPAVVAKHPEVKFYIAGDGNLEVCKAIVKERCIQNNVIFLGWVDLSEKIKYLKLCPYFVLPSYFEAMPMCLLEAMSYFAVCICTKVGSIPEIITSGKNGILTESFELMDLYNAIDKALSNEKDSSVFGENARRIIESNFDIQKSISKLTALYNEV